MVAVAGKGVAILAVDDPPEIRANLVAMAGFQPQSGFGYGAAFALEFFALVGGALGYSTVTHRGVISAITPIALPGANSQQFNTSTNSKTYTSH